MMSEEVKMDPNKSYEWTPEDKFTLSGNEFGYLKQWVTAQLNKPEAQDVIAALNVNGILDNAMSEGIKAGFVKEKVEEAGENTVALTPETEQG